MIHWDLLFRGLDACEELKRLYEEMGISPLAGYLGVSRMTLARKLKKCKIQIRPRGGVHYRVPRDAFPDRWWNMSVEELMARTGYCANYLRRLRRQKLCELAASSRAETEPESTGLQDSTSPSDSKETGSG